MMALSAKVVVVAFPLVGFCCALSPTRASSPENASRITLVQNGKSHFTIVVPDGDDTVTEQFAADELQRYIKRMSGCRLPVQRESDFSDNRAIFLGPCRSVAAMTTSFPADAGDSFVIERKGGHLFICGSNHRSTLFGVYHVLETLGCGWFSPDPLGEVIPKQSTLQLRGLPYRCGTPFTRRGLLLSLRMISLDDGLAMLDWLTKNKASEFTIAAANGAGFEFWKRHRETFLPELRRRDLPVRIIGHSLRYWLPPKKYFPTHPDWFPLIGGKRQVHSKTQINVASEAAAVEVARNIAAYLHACPETAATIGLSQNDGRGVGWDESPASMALYEYVPRFSEIIQLSQVSYKVPDSPAREYSKTRGYFTFLNRVRRRLGEKFPRTYLDALAYNDTVLPPIDPTFAIDSQIYVQSAMAMQRCYTHAIDDPRCTINSRLAQSLRDWVTKTPNVYLYEYYKKWWRAGSLWPIYGVIPEDVRCIRRMGLQGIVTQGDPRNWWIIGLNYCTQLKALWNPDITSETVLQSWCTKLFGPAGKPMQEYYQALTSFLQETDNHVQGETLFLTPEDLAATDALLERALALAGDDDAIRERINRVRAGHRYTQQLTDICQKRVDDANRSALQLIGTLKSLDRDWVVSNCRETRSYMNSQFKKLHVPARVPLRSPGLP